MDKQLGAFCSEKLQSGEHIESVMKGQWAGGSLLMGRLILTSRRLCYFRKGPLGEVFETIPLSKITSVETHPLRPLGTKAYTIKAHTLHDVMAVLVTGEEIAGLDTFSSNLELLRKRNKSSSGRDELAAEAQHTERTPITDTLVVDFAADGREGYGEAEGRSRRVVGESPFLLEKNYAQNVPRRSSLQH